LEPKPTTLLLLICFSVAPFLGNAQNIYVAPERKHITSISLTSYSNEFNSADLGYAYRIKAGPNFHIHTGLAGGFFYPRIQLAKLTYDDLVILIAPNVEFAFGNKHVFYMTIWKNFTVDDQAPIKAAMGYRHVFARKQLALKAFGSFLWTRNVNQLERPTIFTNGGIGISIERNF